MSSGASRSSTTSSSTSSGGGSAASARVPDSYVAITGESTSKCGYCSREDSSHTYGMWAYRLSPHVYQDLIDHGWRRSGQYLYKPAMHQTCCPAYTIRLDATRFQPTRSQKKVARKMRRFLADGVLPGSSGSSTGATGASASAAAAVEAAAGDEDEEMGDDAPAAEQFLAPARAVPSLDTAPPGSAPASSSSPAASPRKPTHVDLATNAAPAEAASAAAGDARGAAEEASPHGVRRTTPKAKKPKVGQKPGPSFADLIAQTESATEASRHRLRIELVPAQFHQDTFDLYKKYQVAIHKDPPSRITESQFTQFLVDSPITFEAVPPRSDAESQTQQHQQKQQQRQQQQRETTGGTDEPPPRGYGSFHQKYYLDDGRLIAVAVLDVLPKCLSSVYFMYDPDFGRLSLGSYSALHEIAFTLSLRGQMPPGLDYYYMGYYIHSCAKMRYKARYRPSDLLCPERFEWVPLQDVVELLDQRPDTALSEVVASTSSENSSDATRIAHTAPGTAGVVVPVKAARAINVPDPALVADALVDMAVVLHKRQLYRLRIFRHNPELRMQIKNIYTRVGPGIISDLVFVAV